MSERGRCGARRDDRGEEVETRLKIPRHPGRAPVNIIKGDSSRIPTAAAANVKHGRGTFRSGGIHVLTSAELVNWRRNCGAEMVPYPDTDSMFLSLTVREIAK